MTPTSVLNSTNISSESRSRRVSSCAPRLSVRGVTQRSLSIETNTLNKEEETVTQEGMSILNNKPSIDSKKLLTLCKGFNKKIKGTSSDYRKNALIKRIGALTERCSLNEIEIKTRINELRDLSHAYKELSRLSFDENDHAELAYILYTQVKCHWMEMAKKHHHEKQAKKYATFCELGASKSTSYSAGLGTSLGMKVGDRLGVSGVINADASYETSYYPDDEGLFFEEKAKTLKGGLKGKADLEASSLLGAHCQAGIEGVYTQSRAKEWNNSDVYVETDGCLVHAPSRDLGDRFLRIFKKKEGQASLIKAQQAAKDSAKRLESLLAKKGSLLDGEDLSFLSGITSSSPSAVRLPLSADVYSFSSEGGVSASASAYNLNAGLGARLKVVKIDSHQYVPEDFVMRDNKNMKESPIQFPETYLAYVKKMENQNNTESLFLDDINAYFSCVEEYDYLKRFNPQNKNKEAFRELRNKKHEIEKKWGALGRHQLIQHMSASYAYLSRSALFEKSEAIQEKLKNPSITHNAERLEKLTSVYSDVHLEISDVKTSLDVNVAGFSGTLDILRRDRVHPSFLREGAYIDVTLTGQISSTFSTLFNPLELTQKIQSLMQDNGLESDFEFDLNADLGAGIALGKTVRFFKPKYSQEIDFDGEKGWRKQFVRNTQSRFVNGSLGGDVPVAPGVSIQPHLGVGIRETKVTHEKIMPEDITYSMVRFNRFYRNNDMNKNNDEWRQFVDKNKSEFKSLFSNMSETNHPISKDLNYFKSLRENKNKNENENEIIDKELDDVIKAFQENKTDANFERARHAFDAVLESFVPSWWKHHQSTWKPLSFTQKADSGLSRGSRLAKKLHIHPRFKKEEKTVKENTPETEDTKL